MFDTLIKTVETPTKWKEVKRKMANVDIDLRLKAAREVVEMLGDMAKLIGRVRVVLDRLVDEFVSTY